MTENQISIPTVLNDQLLDQVSGGVVIITTELDTPGIRRETSKRFRTLLGTSSKQDAHLMGTASANPDGNL